MLSTLGGCLGSGLSTCVILYLSTFSVTNGHKQGSRNHQPTLPQPALEPWIIHHFGATYWSQQSGSCCNFQFFLSGFRGRLGKKKQPSNGGQQSSSGFYPGVMALGWCESNKKREMMPSSREWLTHLPKQLPWCMPASQWCTLCFIIMKQGEGKSPCPPAPFSALQARLDNKPTLRTAWTTCKCSLAGAPGDHGPCS